VSCSSRSVSLLLKCPSHYLIFTRNPTASFNGPCFIQETYQTIISYFGLLPSVFRSMYDFFSPKSYFTENKVRSQMKPSSDSHHERDTLIQWYYNKKNSSIFPPVSVGFPANLLLFSGQVNTVFILDILRWIAYVNWMRGNTFRGLRRGKEVVCKYQNSTAVVLNMVRCWPFVFPLHKRLLNERLHWTVTYLELHWLQQSARLPVAMMQIPQ